LGADHEPCREPEISLRPPGSSEGFGGRGIHRGKGSGIYAH
jgi:hypothetical protein